MSWLKQHPLPLVTSNSDIANDDENNQSNCSDTWSIHSNESASNWGHGTDDTLAVTRVLEKHGIDCCLVGVAALVFYGAGRVRDVGNAPFPFFIWCV